MFKGDVSTFDEFRPFLGTAEKAFIFDVLPHISKNTSMIHNKRCKPATNKEIIKIVGISKATFHKIMGNLLKIKFFSQITMDSKVRYKLYNGYFTVKRMKVSKWRMEHMAYIRSKEWKAKRLLVLARDNNQCQQCGSDGNGRSLHVHHLTYDNFKNEPLEDLVALCGHCHSGAHGK